MDAGNAIDMSLDEIIKLNKKARRSRVAMTIPVRRKRGIVVKKATALRPSLLKNTKSRQTLAAQAIFKRAKQTAAIAAKVAADAAALVSPSYVACIPISSLANAGAAQMKNRKLMVQRRILSKKRVLIRQRQQQQMRRNQDLRSHLNNLPQRQNQISNQRQVRPFNARRSLNRGSRNNNNRNLPRNQRVLSNAASGNRQWQSAPQRIIRPDFSRRGQSNRARLNSSRMTSLPPYQQYIEQARALIRAQEEMRNAPSLRSINRNGPSQNNARNIFVDVPVRNSQAGGDFRGGNRFVRGGRGAGRFRR
ncbi:hypothetical protein ACTXT7_000597 [Hymenolepis weldensis]